MSLPTELRDAIYGELIPADYSFLHASWAISGQRNVSSKLALGGVNDQIRREFLDSIRRMKPLFRISYLRAGGPSSTLNVLRDDLWQLTVRLELSEFGWVFHGQGQYESSNTYDALNACTDSGISQHVEELRIVSGRPAYTWTWIS